MTSKSSELIRSAAWLLAPFAVFAVFDVLVWNEPFTLPGHFSVEPALVAVGRTLALGVAIVVGVVWSAVFEEVERWRPKSAGEKPLLGKMIPAALQSHRTKVALVASPVVVCIGFVTLQTTPHNGGALVAAFLFGFFWRRWIHRGSLKSLLGHLGSKSANAKEPPKGGS